MKTIIATVLGLFMLCLMSTRVAADEGKSGLFTIVKAQYGVGESWADVTDKVVAAVKDDAVTIQVGNNVFGDPAEGSAKSLNVVIRYEGMDLMFNADENSTLTIDRATLDAAVIKEKTAQELLLT